MNFSQESFSKIFSMLLKMNAREKAIYRSRKTNSGNFRLTISEVSVDRNVNIAVMKFHPLDFRSTGNFRLTKLSVDRNFSVDQFRLTKS